MIFDYPQIGTVKTEKFGEVPLIDIKMMSDLDWHKSCLKSRLENPEIYREMLGEDVEATIKELEYAITECEVSKDAK